MTVERPLFTADHDNFRDMARRFFQEEMVPHHAQWEKDRVVPREIWRKAGELGLLCPNMPEAYGGSGADWLYNVVVIEELNRAGLTGPGFMIHSEMCAPYILDYASEELKQEWLPKMVTGEAIGAIGLTEPATGTTMS
jgi:acyl-CoA dehydrogenase